MLRRPTDAAFQEGPAQLGEAAGDAAEENALARGVARVGEMADVVVNEVGRRIAQRLRRAGAVERRRDFDVAAGFPHRIVVVIAIDAEHFVGDGETLRLRIAARQRRDLPREAAAEHPDFRAELFRGEFQLRDRFLGMVHRNYRRRSQPVGEFFEILRRNDIVRPDHRASRFVVRDPRQA